MSSENGGHFVSAWMLISQNDAKNCPIRSFDMFHDGYLPAVIVSSRRHLLHHVFVAKKSNV